MKVDERAKVEQWGYSCGSDQDAAGLAWPVRFKPGVTAALVLAGLLFRWPWFLATAGALGILGTFIQKISWIDLLYNHAVRKVFSAPELRPDPSLRRWLCGMADVFVLSSGLALAGGKTGLAFSLGGVVLFLAGSVVLTGICPPAFLYYLWTKRKG